MLDLGLSVDEVDFEEFSYAEVSWGDPKCGLRFHFLSVLDYQEYVDRGTLPAAAINCDRVTAVVDGSTSHIAIGNDREPAANYTLEFDLFVIHRPLGWLGLVALPLLSVASFIAVIALLRKTLVDLLRRPPLQQERK
ncbi:MAG: hypothetical protein GTO63_23020, partial [Anaerolineae bacterium]|nr:hypothetical protein [Anaerolineae bacterium]NIN97625.1 hypothetical protein [Anaerolineae bacterium]